MGIPSAGVWLARSPKLANGILDDVPVLRVGREYPCQDGLLLDEKDSNMSDEVIGPVMILVGILCAGAVSTWIVRRAAAKRSGSGVVQIVVWARSGKVPGLKRQKKWVKAKVRVGESGQLAWVKPAGDPVAMTLQSHESRPRNKSDLWFLDPGTPVWEAVTADGQELGIVIPQSREQWFVKQLPAADQPATLL
jgi:hypothetical protein